MGLVLSLSVLASCFQDPKWAPWMYVRYACVLLGFISTFLAPVRY